MQVRGIRIVQAVIRGPLQLDFQTVQVPLELSDCTLTAEPTFTGTKMPALRFVACTVPGLSAESIRVEHDLTLTDLSSTGQLNLANAQIGGKLDLSGVTVGWHPGSSIAGNWIRVGGDVLLHSRALYGDSSSKPCTVLGQVSLVDADVRGRLVCDGATIGDGQVAIDASRATIAGGLDMYPVSAGVQGASPRFYGVRCSLLGSDRRYQGSPNYPCRACFSLRCDRRRH